MDSYPPTAMRGSRKRMGRKPSIFKGVIMSLQGSTETMSAVKTAVAAPEKVEKPVTKEKKTTVSELEKMRKEDAKLVTGYFFCHEPKGGHITFPYRKYKEEPTVNYTLHDGKEYTLPLGVVKHLNNCSWEVHTHLLDKDGNPYVGTGKKERRFTFQGSDFM